MGCKGDHHEESKDLKSMEFNALAGSPINYEIVLKAGDGRAKHSKALKVFTHYRKDESEGDISVDEEKDENLKFYSKRIATYEKLLKNKNTQQKEMEMMLLRSMKTSIMKIGSL